MVSVMRLALASALLILLYGAVCGAFAGVRSVERPDATGA